MIWEVQTKPELCKDQVWIVKWTQVLLLENHKVMKTWNVVFGNPILEAVPLDWKSRFHLFSKITWTLQARVRCFILAEIISNSKFLIVCGFWQRSSSVSEDALVNRRRVVRIFYSCGKLLGECFSLNLQLAFSISVITASKRAGQIFAISDWANFYFLNATEYVVVYQRILQKESYFNFTTIMRCKAKQMLIGLFYTWGNQSTHV